jgi:hypothetical protein
MSGRCPSGRRSGRGRAILWLEESWCVVPAYSVRRLRNAPRGQYREEPGTDAERTARTRDRKRGLTSGEWLSPADLPLFRVAGAG